MRVRCGVEPRAAVPGRALNCAGGDVAHAGLQCRLLGEADVGETRVQALVEQNVGRLDVAV